MADEPLPSNRPQGSSSFARRELQTRIARAETIAMGMWGVGAILLLIGLLLAIFGKGFLLLLLGGILFLAGGIENVRAEILKLHAKIGEKD